MTDKELLELAAKAAGYKYGDLDVDGLWASIQPNGCYAIWRPLTDDGDALRLAVKLGFNVSCDTTEDNETTVIFEGGRFTCEKHKGDPYAATRRAIVRAAAEIGRAK